MLLKKHLKVPVTRAYKETRPSFSLPEKKSFDLADRIVLNHIENYNEFKKKYKMLKWKKKEVLVGLDEDWRSETTQSQIEFNTKLSNRDNKVNVVILTGVARSDESDKRSGTRQFYIPLIKELIFYGYVVHLHAFKIEADINGLNQYALIQKNNPEHFFIKPSLDLKGDPGNSYSILSSYDFGVLHNFRVDSDVSRFDKINIPNRLYEYLLAGVVPIVKRGETIVVEDLFNHYRCGFIYDSLKDLEKASRQEFKNYTPTFKQYIAGVFIFDK